MRKADAFFIEGFNAEAIRAAVILNSGHVGEQLFVDLSVLVCVEDTGDTAHDVYLILDRVV